MSMVDYHPEHNQKRCLHLLKTPFINLTICDSSGCVLSTTRIAVSFTNLFAPYIPIVHINWEFVAYDLPTFFQNKHSEKWG